MNGTDGAGPGCEELGINGDNQFVADQQRVWETDQGDVTFTLVTLRPHGRSDEKGERLVLGGPGSAGLKIGLGELRGLFQSQCAAVMSWWHTTGYAAGRKELF